MLLEKKQQEIERRKQEEEEEMAERERKKLDGSKQSFIGTQSQLDSRSFIGGAENPNDVSQISSNNY